VEDIKGKKIEITVPEGYDFVQEGNSCYFIKKEDNKNFASWEQKDKLVTGYFIDKESKICRLKDFSKSSRSEEDKNVFKPFISSTSFSFLLLLCVYSCISFSFLISLITLSPIFRFFSKLGTKR
jgi:hypothetical protein